MPSPRCVCGLKLPNEVMVPSKLRSHVITNHSNLLTETMVYFQRLLQANSRQRKLFQKAMAVSERAQLALYEVAEFKGVRKGLGVFGVNPPPLSLIFYKSFITCAKEISCFRILLLVNLLI